MFSTGAAVTSILLLLTASGPPAPNSNGVISSGNFRLIYKPTKWRVQKNTTDVFELTHVKGAAYARFIIGQRRLSTEKLVEVAIEDFKKADAGAHEISREPKTIDGVTIISLRVEAVPRGVPLTFWGYYFGGDAGTVQILTYVGSSSFEKYEPDLGELLDGLQIGQ